MNQTVLPPIHKTLATQAYAVTVYTAIALLPQAQQELTYQFTVEHPPDLTVIGLNM